MVRVIRVRARVRARIRVRVRVRANQGSATGCAQALYTTPHLLEERRLEHHTLDGPFLRKQVFVHSAVVPELGDFAVVLVSEALVHTAALRVVILLPVGAEGLEGLGPEGFLEPGEVALDIFPGGHATSLCATEDDGAAVVRRREGEDGFGALLLALIVPHLRVGPALLHQVLHVRVLGRLALGCVFERRDWLFLVHHVRQPRHLQGVLNAGQLLGRELLGRELLARGQG
eukprot:scaffold40708_cov62-Phaeocystis_antarctica.AAC.2